MTRTWKTRTVLPVLGALAALLLSAGPASAHDVITGSDPADGSSLAQSPARVSVTFDEAPQPGFSTLTVVGPDGSRWEQGTAVADGGTISIGVNRLGPAGKYEIGFRVVSDDGHPVAGAIAFTLTTPGGGTANGVAPAAAAPGSPQAPSAQATTAPAPQAQPSPAASSEATSGGGVPAWPFVVLAVVVVGGALALVLRRRTC